MKTSSLAHILTGKGSELFVCDDQPYITHNRMTVDLLDAPEKIKSALVRFIKADPEREKAYVSMAGDDVNAQMSQCVKCMFANLDGVPDIDENGMINNTEFVPCEKRGGGCKFEGIACNKLSMSGNEISKSEMRVLEVCQLEEKEIAEKLCLSPATVKRHSQNIRIKTGIPSGKKLALWASSMGVINLDQLCF
ncbi:response regulator transcription factor [Pedobacter lusitanus]|nr:LuxR C-terminal-related transcriptional regulator [Pedobacter lusitanus]